MGATLLHDAHACACQVQHYTPCRRLGAARLEAVQLEAVQLETARLQVGQLEAARRVGAQRMAAQEAHLSDFLTVQKDCQCRCAWRLWPRVKMALVANALPSGL